MPRKQKQRQSQKQTVIVNIREPSKKKRGTRRRKSAPRDGVSSMQTAMQTALPPPVIYQSTYSIPYPVQAPPPIQVPVKESVFLTDVGQVGTEGRVEILESPTKKEQQSEMISPVPSEIAGFADLEGLRKRVQTAFVQTQTDRTKIADMGSQTKYTVKPATKTIEEYNKMMESIRENEERDKQQMPPIQTDVEQVILTGFPDSGLSQRQQSITEQIPVESEVEVEKENENKTIAYYIKKYKELTGVDYNPKRGEKKEVLVNLIKTLEQSPTEALQSIRMPQSFTASAAPKTPQMSAQSGISAQFDKPVKKPKIPRPSGLASRGTIAYYKTKYTELTGRDFVFQKGQKKQDLIDAVKFEMTTTKA